MTPYFSIIIPTLNEEQRVGELLEDLTRQTCKELEVIHVDGHSTDGTVRIVESYAHLLPIKTLPVSRRNLAFQRNYGAAHARGVYLVCVDADVRLPDAHFLQTLKRCAQDDDSDVYLPDAQFEDREVWWIKIAEKINNWGVRITQNSPRPLPSSSLAIFKRSFFDSIGGYTTTEEQDKGGLFVEDQDIMFRAKQAGSKNRVVADTHFRFSVRRLRQDGWVRTLIKVFIASLELLTHKRISHLPYKMGGHAYKNDIK